MDLRSAVIVNNRPLAAPGGGAGDMVDYAAREGRFGYGGCDRSITGDDERLMRRPDVRSMVDYAAREGRFYYRALGDAPIAAGDRSGGLWGRDGVVDAERWKRLIEESGSHVMRSVITVRREDADALGLTTKEDWQRAVRAHWDGYARSWGVIAPGCIEWAAAFHVDNPENLHVHIMTIDSSGRWSGGLPEIPHGNHAAGTAALREELYRPLITREEAEASALRDWMRARVRADLGIREPAKEYAIQQRLAPYPANVLPAPSEHALAPETARDAAERMLSAMPGGDERVLSYARSSAEVRRAAREMVSDLIARDRLLAAAYSRFEGIQHDKAIARGNTGIDASSGRPVDREAEAVRKGMHDLNKRLANAGLSALRDQRGHGRGRRPSHLPDQDARSERAVREEGVERPGPSALSSLRSAANALAYELLLAATRAPGGYGGHGPHGRPSLPERERNTHEAMSETRLSAR